MKAAFATAGIAEETKAAWHAAAFAIVGIMGVYNLCAWATRREWHLAANAALYFSLAEWERRQVAHHLEAWRKA